MSFAINVLIGQWLIIAIQHAISATERPGKK